MWSNDCCFDPFLFLETWKVSSFFPDYFLVLNLVDCWIPLTISFLIFLTPCQPYLGLPVIPLYAPYESPTNCSQLFSLLRGCSIRMAGKSGQISHQWIVLRPSKVPRIEGILGYRQVVQMECSWIDAVYFPSPFQFTKYFSGTLYFRLQSGQTVRVEIKPKFCSSKWRVIFGIANQRLSVPTTISAEFSNCSNISNW